MKAVCVNERFFWFVFSKIQNEGVENFLSQNSVSSQNSKKMLPSLGQFGFSVVFLLGIVLPVSAPARVPRFKSSPSQTIT
jgi:hypothetical protein